MLMRLENRFTFRIFPQNISLTVVQQMGVTLITAESSTCYNLLPHKRSISQVAAVPCHGCKECHLAGELVQTFSVHLKGCQRLVKAYVHPPQQQVGVDVVLLLQCTLQHNNCYDTTIGSEMIPSYSAYSVVPMNAWVQDLNWHPHKHGYNGLRSRQRL